MDKKNLIWVIAILIIAVGAILENRYAFIIDSPIVARIDRFTGNIWIVNSGVWRKVHMSPQENSQEKASAATTTKAAK